MFSNVTIFHMLKNENYETSIYSHLTRNEKWKLWVRWHGSSWWLLCLCALCFVFCALPKQSSVLECHHISYFEKWKLWAIFFDKFLRRSNYDWEKLLKEKKDCVSFFGKCECSRISPYFIFWKMKIMSYVFQQVSSLMKLWPEKITTGKKSTMLVYLVLWGNSFWYYLHT